MAVLLAIPVLLALLILQMGLVSNMPLLHGSADLLLLALVAWALNKRVRTAWLWAVLAGLMVAFVSALPPGVALVGYLIAVGLALLIRQRIWQAPLLAMLATTFLATLFFHAISLAVLRVQGAALPLLEAFNQITLPSILLNLLLAIPIYALMGELAGWVYPDALES